MATTTDVVYLVFAYDYECNLFVFQTMTSNDSEAIKICNGYKFGYVIKDAINNEVIYRRNCRVDDDGRHPGVDFSNFSFKYIHILMHEFFYGQRCLIW